MIGNGSAPMLAGAIAPHAGLRGYLVLNTMLLLGVLTLWVLQGPGAGPSLRGFGRWRRAEEQ
jgi:hypothetical protein